MPLVDLEKLITLQRSAEEIRNVRLLLGQNIYETLTRIADMHLGTRCESLAARSL